MKASEVVVVVGRGSGKIESWAMAKNGRAAKAKNVVRILA
jgi:hypothetical protein